MPQTPSPAAPVRALLAAISGSGLTLLLGRAASGLVAGTSEWVSPDRLVAVAIALLGLGAGVVLSTGCWLLAAAALAPRLRPATWCGRLGARLTPAALRRAVGLTVGAGMGVAMLSGIALAPQDDLGWEITTGSGVEGGGPTPEAPAEDPETRAPSEAPGALDEGSAAGERQPDDQGALSPQSSCPEPDPATEGGSTSEPRVSGVTVLPGDSLWRIAAKDLGEASDSQIAAAWPRWYAANRAVIGPDPDLIHPGQVLVRPEPAEGTP